MTGFTLLISIFFIFFSGFFQSPSFDAFAGLNFPQEKPFVAKIETENNKDKLNIIAKFYNNTDSTFSLYYEMETNKISGSGKSLSNQSGKFNSEPKETSILSKVGLNIEEDAQYKIILKIFEGEKLISADSLNFILNQ